MSPLRARLQRLAANLTLMSLALLATFLATELVFRSVPSLLPAGVYGAGRYDPDLGMNVYGSEVIYNKGRRVRKVPNRHGFMDVDHDEPKPPGTLRLAFFGDSYVESHQVPLEQTFFRRLQRLLADQPVEILAFGISGWGTLQSFLNYQVQSDRFGIDLVVYVFVENDPGDNSYSISGVRYSGISPRPFAELAEAPPGYRIHRVSDGGVTPLRKLLKAVHQHSLLAQTLADRWQLLRQRGIDLRPSPDSANMAEPAGSRPRATDRPDTWPAPYREESETLLRRILRQWSLDASERGQQIVVLYVPRSEEQLRGTLPKSATWKPVLEEICAELDLRLLDPSHALRELLERGQRVYDDHWTPAAHEAVATALVQDLAGILPLAPATPKPDPHRSP